MLNYNRVYSSFFHFGFFFLQVIINLPVTLKVFSGSRVSFNRVPYGSVFEHIEHVDTTWSQSALWSGSLLTFLGSLYKEVAKTTSGTLVYRFERQTARKKILPSKNSVHVGLYLRNTTQWVTPLPKKKKKNSMASLAVTKTTANFFYDFRSSMNSEVSSRG